MAVDNRQRRKKSRGHGCAGFALMLIVIVAVFCILLFTTDIFSGPKTKILGWFYHQKYAQEVQTSAQEFGVDENLIYAVIRTESKFDADAESHAGAVGLMQLMPQTFTWLQEKLDGTVSYDTSDLKTPAVNIRYGTYYLKYLSELYGNTSTALAAYNAGVANVDKWLSDSAYSADGKTLTDIPYEETKNYVDKVEHAYEMYVRIYG